MATIHGAVGTDETVPDPDLFKMYDATPHWVVGNKTARPLQERALVIDKPAPSAGSGLAGGEADICDARGCRAGTPTRFSSLKGRGRVKGGFERILAACGRA